jgi:hypothetical protein
VATPSSLSTRLGQCSSKLAEASIEIAKAPLTLFENLTLHSSCWLLKTLVTGRDACGYLFKNSTGGVKIKKKNLL